MPKLRKLVPLALMLPLIISYDFTRSLLNPVTDLSDAVSSASQRIETNVRGDSHLGFDTYSYPGDAAMLAWRDESVPYEWVGYYLPSPCHKSDSWAGKRRTLTDMGWGLAVVFVGQQVWSGVPRQKIVTTKYVTKRVKTVTRSHGRRVVRNVSKRVPVRIVTYARAEPGSSCSTHLVSASRGTADANEAITRTASDGFAPGTVIFLDIERMESVPTAMREYYEAWTSRVLGDGRYRPGYYTHDHNAEQIFRDVSRQFAGAGVSATPQFWIASERGFTEDKSPGEVGHSFANVWQGMLDVIQTHNGVRLPIDVNVASVPSPSSHEYALGASD